MELDSEGYPVRIFIGESECRRHEPLHEAIVLKSRELGMACATVLRRVMGCGATVGCLGPRSWRLSDDPPLVVEIVHSKERIDALLPQVHAIVNEGLVAVKGAGHPPPAQRIASRRVAGQTEVGGTRCMTSSLLSGGSRE